MSRILALWLPNWPVQRLVRDQPELAGRALVLYEQAARHGQRVKACSAAAEQQAVRPGMPLAEAQTLLAGDPLFACHDARRDREALVELAEWCEQFSPIVGLDQTDEPDSLLMDVSGLAHLFGGEEALAQAVVSACGAGTGIACGFGTGHARSRITEYFGVSLPLSFGIFFAVFFFRWFPSRAGFLEKGS